MLSDADENLNGKEMVIQSYDDDSNIIDQVKGKSISITADDTFGNGAGSSNVINFTVGGKQMLQVGSSTIAYEKGVHNYLDDYLKTVDIENQDRSIPFLNRMINDLKNATTGKDMVILVRNQTGKPIATFIGNDVSYFASDVEKATEFLVDGKLVFVYRCNISAYDMDLLK